MTWYEDPVQYDRNTAVPPHITREAGPNGMALLDVYKDGRTTKGWGLVSTTGDPDFMPNYAARKFWDKPRILDYEKREIPFAFVMRSLNVIALDIDRHMGDGGHDGFKSAAKLSLPPTLAETSKGGGGRHLFYLTDDTWDDQVGFGRYEDVIGLAPGIDVRAVGCVYHYPSQRWNRLPIEQLPDSVRDVLEARRLAKQYAKNLRVAAATADPDDEEALIMHDQLLTDLNAPIATGKRNVSLFAIASKMHEAGYPDWPVEIHRRGQEIGLDADEVDKIIANASKYKP